MNFPDFLPVLDVDQVRTEARNRHEDAKMVCSRDGRFIGCSLGAWLEHVRACGLAHVPAQQIAALPRDVFLRFDSPACGDEAHWENLQDGLSSLPTGHMTRWDHCSSLDLKSALAEGRLPSRAEATSLEPWDPRAYDLAMAYPGDQIPVWSRPWVKAVAVDGYPLEFRVFVENGHVIGVASYHPQRPLPQTMEMTDYAFDCHRRAERLVAHLNSQRSRPWMPSYEGRFAESAVSATFDFLVSESGELLFLEAGPAFGAGAHPCAFLDRPISGVALSLASGVELR